LVGDTNGNHVQISENSGVGSYKLTSGDGTTLFRLNGAGATFTEIPSVNGIIGPVNILLGTGNDTLELLGSSSTDLMQIQGDLTITNDDDSNTNRLDKVELLGTGGLVVTRPPGGIVSNSTLEIKDTIIDYDVSVANDAGGGGGPAITKIESTDATTPITRIRGDVWISNNLGQTETEIIDSRIQGILDINNDPDGSGAEEDVVRIRGTAIGADYFVPPPAPPPVTPLGGALVVGINNGDGSSITSFTRGREAGAPTGAGRVTVYGAIDIDNGDTVVGKFDFVEFSQTDVLGWVDVANFDGATTTLVDDSNLGMDFAAAPALGGVGFGGPLVVTNGDGRDDNDIINSEIQWGVDLVNGVPGEMWGSDTNINGSMIGHHPFGPMLPGLPGVGLNIDGDDAADAITMDDSSVGGNFDLTDMLGGNDAVILTNVQLPTGTLSYVGAGGNDSLELLSSGSNRTALAGLEFTGDAGDDTVRVVDSDILLACWVSLGDDLDRLELRGSSTLPPSLFFIPPFLLDGGMGADELGVDLGILLPFPATGFEIPLP
jgi:hypothetical protein